MRFTAGKRLGLQIPACLALVFISVISGFGQNPAKSFELSGVLVDPSGAVIADAKVVLRREGQRQEHSTTTNQKGEFRFTRLTSGNYEIEARKDGFKQTITPLTVGGKSPALLEIELPIGD